VKLSGPLAVQKDIGAPDERQHVNYIARLSRGEGFPILNPTDPNLYETYQAHQPPLFYGLMLIPAKLIGLNDPENPSGRALRWVNVLIGAVTLLGIYRLATNLGLSEPGAIGSVAFAALLPMHAALNGAVSNDPLLFCLCTWVTAYLAEVAMTSWTARSAITIGILTGLACLTKTTALALFPAILGVAVIRRDLKFAGIALVLPLFLAGGWWVRNVQLYGDPFALKAFAEAFTGSAQKSLFTERIIPVQRPGESAELIYWFEYVGWWTLRSFYGVFGYMDIWLTQSGLPAADLGENRLYVVLALFGAVGLIAGVFAGLKDRKAKVSHLVLVGISLVVVVLFLRFNNQYFQAQARYLYPAIGAISVWVGLGFSSLLKARPQFVVATIALPLVLANLFALIRLPSEFDKAIDAGKAVQASQP
jgi:4-amino-4-deoxy-L-arabinose transferase-like glycosyltransferase